MKTCSNKDCTQINPQSPEAFRKHRRQCRHCEKRRNKLRREEALVKGYVTPDNKNCTNETCIQNNPQPLSCFDTRPSSRDGRRSHCKDCRKKKRDLNKPHAQQYGKEYRAARKDFLKIQGKQYVEEHKEAIKTYKKQWAHNNKEKRAAKDKLRRQKDLLFRLKGNLRTRMNQAIKKNYKTGSAVRDLGCSIEFFKEYIERQFQPGMSWDNWGLSTWHIDHIISLSTVDLADRDQFLKVVHYTNQRPMWADQNIREGARNEKL